MPDEAEIEHVLPLVLYHGTSRLRFDEFIAAEGLRPKSGAAGVFLTTSLVHAEGYARYAVELDADDVDEDERHDNAWMILVVETVEMDVALLRPDDYELADMVRTGANPLLAGYGDAGSVPWHVGLAACEQVAYAGRIRRDVVHVAMSVDEARAKAGAIAEAAYAAEADPFGP